jgi:hypothetical protein
MHERFPSLKESLTIFKPTYFKETAEPVVIGTEASKKIIQILVIGLFTV